VLLDSLARTLTDTYHSPGCFAFADIENKMTDYLLSFRGMSDLWMKLNAKEGFAFVRNGSERRGARFSNYHKVFRGFRDLVTM
jgi:hypothetical protein